MKFAIITYIEHAVYNGKFYSYEPYISEMNIWLNEVDEFMVLAPKINRKPLAGETAYIKDPVFAEVPALSFKGLTNILLSLFRTS